MRLRSVVPIALNVALGGVMIIGAGSSAWADKDYAPACRDRLNSDKAKIDRDSHKFGEKSSQVQHDVGKMDSDRSWCKSHHAEWDHNTFDIGIYMR